MFVRVVALDAPSNFVTVSGSRFATLANSDPNSNCGPNDDDCSCQGYNTYLSLPAGWIIAPYNCQTAFAAGCYGWNTGAVVASDGSFTHTKAHYNGPFYRYTNNYLLSSSGSGGVATYSVSICNLQILITDNVNAAAAACPNLPTTCK